MVAAQRDNKVLFLHSCGWRGAERGTPVGLDHQYKIFSTSTAITATAILRLVDRGRETITVSRVGDHNDARSKIWSGAIHRPQPWFNIARIAMAGLVRLSS